MNAPVEQRRACTAALLTPRGRGAVTTVELRGETAAVAVDSHFRAANGRPLADQPLGRIVFGRWGTDAPEEVVVCRVAEGVVEIHCHGGELPARRILSDLECAGCEVVSWQQSLARTRGLFEAECLEALTNAPTERTAGIILEQQSGVLQRAFAELIQDVRAKRTAGAVARLDDLLRRADFGLHLTRSWNVVLAGRPNVGKSSLINALVGYSRSIVYDEPGTTRDVVTAETAFDGWPVRLSDTAGIRDQAGTLEAAGIERARAAMRAADCRLLLLDTSRPPNADDIALLAAWPDSLIVAHKSDLPDAWGGELPAAAIRVSSVTREGIAALINAIVARVVPKVPKHGTAIPITDRQVSLLRSARAAAAAGDNAVLAESLKDLISAKISAGGGPPADHQ